MGLGVLARDPMMAVARYDERWTYFLPVELPTLRLNVLGTWAFNHRAKKVGSDRIGSCLPVLESMRDWLSQARSVMVGDFNHNPRWDTPRGRNNFRDICGRLDALRLKSAYHVATGEAHGSELQHTHYLYRNATKSYHIDYCFLHADVGPATIRVPPFEEWRSVSDHVPLIIDINDA
jgi:endonuclease/exonuclease/phosphatase family metal-dependent hydrolase